MRSTTYRPVFLFAFIVLALALVAGCGATLTAVGVLIAESGGSSSGRSNSLPAASMTSPTGTQAGDITLSYSLIDAEGNPVDISIAYTFDGTDFYETSEAPIAPSEGRMALTTSPTGSPHTFLWNTYRDLHATGPLTVKLRITLYDSLTDVQGEWSLSESFMMIPRKSVSFAIHIAEKPARMRSENSCRNCDIKDCPYRLLT